MTAEKPVVLVVDDAPDNIALASSLLKSEYKVKVATNGAKALQIVEQAAPDLILLDVMMPVLDGYETCRRLQADPVLADIPVRADRFADLRRVARNTVHGNGERGRHVVVLDRARGRLRERRLQERPRLSGMRAACGVGRRRLRRRDRGLVVGQLRRQHDVDRLVRHAGREDVQAVGRLDVHGARRA